MKKAKSSVSIVIPAYNEESQLYGCLSAIENQTDFPDEVIVVNNNSSDSTVAIAHSFPFVKVIHEPHQGLRAARNAGVAAAHGDIVARIDADTRLNPSWVADARRIFRLNPKVMALTGPVYYHDMPLKTTSLKVDNFLRKNLFKLQKYPLLYGSNMAFRRLAWEKVLPNLCGHGEFFEDVDLTIHFKDLRLKMAYVENLVSGVSARRMDNAPGDFYKNSKLYNQTFWRHGRRTGLAASGAKWVFLTLYPFCKIIRQFYAAESLLLSEAQRQKLSPRPNSNT